MPKTKASTRVVFNVVPIHSLVLIHDNFQGFIGILKYYWHATNDSKKNSWGKVTTNLVSRQHFLPCCGLCRGDRAQILRYLVNCTYELIFWLPKNTVDRKTIIFQNQKYDWAGPPSFRIKSKVIWSYHWIIWWYFKGYKSSMVDLGT